MSVCGCCNECWEGLVWFVSMQASSGRTSMPMICCRLIANLESVSSNSAGLRLVMLDGGAFAETTGVGWLRFELQKIMPKARTLSSENGRRFGDILAAEFNHGA